jgi:hypothetical protein
MTSNSSNQDRRSLNAEIRQAHHERQLGKPHGPSPDTMAKLMGKPRLK